MGVNVKGVWLCMKYQLPLLLAQGGGAIVNTASVAGLGAAPKMSIYAASKHAVIGLTKSAAIEYAKKKIRVNAVCPAVIDTDMFRRAYEADPKKGEFANAMHPVGRIGKVEEIASAVLYLCSDGAAFTTGHSLAVDGGVTAFEGRIFQHTTPNRWKRACSRPGSVSRHLCCLAHPDCERVCPPVFHWPQVPPKAGRYVSNR
jgi:NAD(P)-dependent dehydrogenase (short-subunit alcohol dehydrogenase family)